MGFAQELGAARMAAGFYDHVFSGPRMVLEPHLVTQPVRRVEFPDRPRMLPIEAIVRGPAKEQIWSSLPPAADAAMTAREIAEETGLPVRAVSVQLSAMRGLVKRVGTTRRYRYWRPADA